jgi:hypothetical protein
MTADDDDVVVEERREAPEGVQRSDDEQDDAHEHRPARGLSFLDRSSFHGYLLLCPGLRFGLADDLRLGPLEFLV